jgi:2'-hydroxyisoflavone reductase
VDRRDFTKRSLMATAVSACSSSFSLYARAQRTPKHILVLGGTFFLGLALVEALVAEGHTVTLFNRGITNPTAFSSS